MHNSICFYGCPKRFWNDCTHNSRLQKFPIDIEIWLLGGTPTLMNIENCPKVICHQVADTLQFETHLAASSYILDERKMRMNLYLKWNQARPNFGSRNVCTLHRYSLCIIQANEFIVQHRQILIEKFYVISNLQEMQKWGKREFCRCRRYNFACTQRFGSLIQNQKWLFDTTL